jgi:hypothetical protein
VKVLVLMQKKIIGSGGSGGSRKFAALSHPAVRRHVVIKIIGDIRIDVVSFEVGRQRSIADSKGALGLGQPIGQVSHAPRLQASDERCSKREDQGGFS